MTEKYCIENDFAAQKELAEMERHNSMAIWEENKVLRARVARLEDALKEIRDYDSYKHPDETVIALRDAAIKDASECSACQYAKTVKWPASGLCSEHYSTVTRAEDKVKQMFEYKQTWEPREIARRALEEK